MYYNIIDQLIIRIEAQRTEALVLSFEHCFILFSSFPLLLEFGVGGLGFEFCVFVAGWRHALRSEWPFIIMINNKNRGTENPAENLDT